MKRFFYDFPIYSEFIKIRKTKQQINFLSFIKFNLFGSKLYWPHEKNCTIANPQKIFVGINSGIGRSGCYFQGAGGMYIGDYVRIANNVGIITSNHDLIDHNISHYNKVIIGDYSWIGMNSVILPGVELGTRTIVAAGSVVTKSFPEGFCVIGGNPAKKIKDIDKESFIPWKYDFEYYGFIPKNEFEKEKRKYLDPKMDKITK
jgi:acetyltransferase-like isoleucine patch superfamily enzyme